MNYPPIAAARKVARSDNLGAIGHTGEQLALNGHLNGIAAATVA